jgi:aminoglycoside 3-N-acetyltransferase
MIMWKRTNPAAEATNSPMRQVTQQQVADALQAVGVRPGDGLLVHSALQFLGQPVGGVGIYYQALRIVLEGKQSPESTSPHSQFATPNSQIASPDSPLHVGTIALPTFNFAFARGDAYDPQETPSAGMGAFSEYVRRLPFALRTPHPMQSLAVVGRHAADLAQRDTPSAFDPGSAFERMLELDFRLLLLGAAIQATAMLHYCEQRASVPYRYWKDFTGQVNTGDGWQERIYRMFVRDLSIDPKIELYPVQDVLKERGLWTSQKLNYGDIAQCRLLDFVTVVDEFLAGDPWSLVTNRPPVV